MEKLKQYHLDPREKFGHLSKGQKLKCQFAFALACHPAYLFLDEPVANFDPEFKSNSLRTCVPLSGMENGQLFYRHMRQRIWTDWQTI